jgi:glycerol-3-phosphate dehydrogenase (NAD(P)+)
MLPRMRVPRRAPTVPIMSPPQSRRLAVIGAGSWGTTVASLACVTTPTRLWARRAELAEQITRDHVNGRYLAEFKLPVELAATASMSEAVRDADMVLLCVPSHGCRSVLGAMAPLLSPHVPIVSLAKGLEPGTSLRVTEIVTEVAPGHPTGVLTGPNLAREILAGQPAACVVAAQGPDIADELQRIFSSRSLRVYTNADVVGCEICGAAKNVMAIAAGMAYGMGFGDNSRATLVTRGLAEMARLGIALGADPLTFSGLAGMGDLVATCSSRHSRNFRVGEALGLGRHIADITADTAMIAEGVMSSATLRALARRNGVDVPLTEAVASVCHDGCSAADAVAMLMARVSGAETTGLVSPQWPR